MRSKKTSLHPLLILLAVALVSVLFVVSCGDGATATAVPRVADETDAAAEAAALAAAAEAADEAQAAEAAAKAAKAAETAAMAAEEAAAAEAAKAAETAAMAAEEAAAAEAAEAAAAQAAELAAARAGAPKYGGTLRVAAIADSFTLDPALFWSVADIVIHQSLYDNLLMIQPDLSVKPELATSWEANDDNSSYTFQLRRGVKFHHGKDFKAEDVLFSFNRLLDPVVDSGGRTLFRDIEDIVALDDYTVRFDLEGPNAFFVEYLSMEIARILPADVDSERLVLEEFGTGPFILEEHLPGERTTMVRNPDYWEEGKPYLDEIVILLLAEAATRAEALKSGDVDIAYHLEPLSTPGIEAHPDTEVLVAPPTTAIVLEMDNSRPPFDNILVRKAMQAATDRETIGQAALLGLGSLGYDHSIPPDDPLFASQYAPPAYDPDFARSLLEQAGYPDGLDITLHTGDIGPGMIEMAVAYKESAAPAGIRVEVQRHSCGRLLGHCVGSRALQRRSFLGPALYGPAPE